MTTFQPTRFASTLTSRSPPLSDREVDDTTAQEGHQGFIVLETNYHVYAYTSWLPYRIRFCPSNDL
jgi:hypothetical protein